jgi:hypothetical protein
VCVCLGFSNSLVITCEMDHDLLRGESIENKANCDTPRKQMLSLAHYLTDTTVIHHEYLFKGHVTRFPIITKVHMD